MYSYIKGTLERKSENFIVIDNGGIGYRVFTSLNTINNIGDIGIEVKIFTHLYVREDIMCLYGFITLEEVHVFKLLLSVSGVGPKAAGSMLSATSPSEFALAVITGDINTLSKAQGVGKKIAARIALELKDKIDTEDAIVNSNSYDNNQGDIMSEAISALMVLGYSSMEANRAVTKAYDLDMDIKEIIKQSLIFLSGRKER